MKKILSALLAIAMLLPVLASCKPGDTTDPDTPKPEMQTVDHVYRGEYISTEEDISLRTNGYTLSGDVLTFRASKVLEKNEEGRATKTAQIFYHISLADGSASVTEIPQKLTAASEEEHASVTSAAASENGMAVLEYYYSRSAGRMGKYLLTVYDKAGRELYSLDPEPLVENRTDPMSEMRGFAREWSFSCQGLYFGGNGTLYMVTEYSIVALSPDGKKLYEVGCGGYINETTLTAEGKLLVKYTDFSNNHENVTAYMDDEKKGFGEKLAPPAVSMRNYEIHIGPDFDFYLQTDTGVYGMNAADTEPTLLCNWVNSDIDPKAVRSMLIVDRDTFVYVGNDPVTYETEVAVLKSIPDEEVQPRYLITLAATYFSYNVTGYIVKFNRQSDTYRVVMKNYSESFTPEELSVPNSGPDALLEADILAGTTPDILYAQTVTADMANYASKGVFADLYPFMENDASFDKSNLLSCILAPFETDGKLYHLCAGVGISGYAGKTKNVSAYTNWTIDTCLKLLEDAKKAGKTAISDMTRETMEQMLLYANLDSFIDYENVSCSFDSDSFLKTIELLKSLPTSEQYYANYDYQTARQENSAGLRNDKILLYSGRNLGTFTDYIQQKAMFLNEPITYLGIPTPEGGALGLQGENSYSIFANSPVKEGAWQFVSFMLSDEVMINEEMRHNGGFPATKSALKALAEQEKKMYYTFDLDGSGWGGSSWDGITPPVRDYDPEKEIPGYLTDADVAFVMDMLENSRFVVSSASVEEKLRSLIAEELGALYAGNATAEATADKIQSRVSIYLSEKS